MRARPNLEVWRLSGSGLEALGEEASAAALAFQHSLAARLADRVLGANRLVRYLSRWSSRLSSSGGAEAERRHPLSKFNKKINEINELERMPTAKVVNIRSRSL